MPGTDQDQSHLNVHKVELLPGHSGVGGDALRLSDGPGAHHHHHHHHYNHHHHHLELRDEEEVAPRLLEAREDLRLLMEYLLVTSEKHFVS